jgi:parvulin-like peptidyl-prolyl isomerase
MMDDRLTRLHFTIRSAGVAVVVLLAAGCEGAFSSRVDVAATASGAELPVAVLAEVFAQNRQLPLRRDVAEGLALLWVDFTLFANQVARGDSLLDSLTVLAATWPDVQQTLASAYHTRLFGDSMQLDSARIDSIYAAGDYRIVQHVLFRAADTNTAEVQGLKRAQAEYVRGQLRRGEVTWSEAVSVTDEPGGVERDGSLGLVARGELVDAFEEVAFALAPGEMSNVVRTSTGFHIVRRPPLADVREAFRAAVQKRLDEDADSLYLEQLEDKWEIEVRRGAVPAVREMAIDPLRAKQSAKVIGSHREGAFRVRDLARWLQGMDPQIRQGLVSGSDEQIQAMVRTLIRNEVLIREARSADVALTPDNFETLKDYLRRRIALVRGHLKLVDDTIAEYRALPAPAQQERVQRRVTAHLQDLARENRSARIVPPFLADHLRDQAQWDIVPAGIERAIAQARDLRDTRPDAGRPARPRPPPQAPAESSSSSPPSGGGEGEGT